VQALLILYVSIAIWLVANILMGFWLFSAASGWKEVKCLPYTKRLRLVWFGERGIDVTNPEDLASMRKFARRFRAYFCFVFSLPMVVFYGILYAVYAA
jgi:hypothetical protein